MPDNRSVPAAFREWLSDLRAHVENLKYLRLADLDWRLRFGPAILPGRWFGAKDGRRINLGVPLAMAYSWLIRHTLCRLTRHRGECDNPYGETLCVDCGLWLSWDEADRAIKYVEGF